MISGFAVNQVYLATGFTDMRKSINLTRTSRNQEGNVFFGKKIFSAVRGNLDDPPIHVPQNVPALAGLNKITFVGSSLYGTVIFT